MAPQDPQVHGPHPSDEDLLLAIAGELPPDTSPIVRQHLEHCPLCQEKMRGTRATLETLVTCVQLAQPEPPPTRVRARRERLEDLLDAARADREASSLRRWLAAAAALVAFLAGMTLFRNGRVAYADEVVARAAQREHAFNMPADRWRFRFSPVAGSQTASEPHDPGAPAWQDEPDKALPAHVIQMLQAHGFDPDRPLSVGRLKAWRTSQPHRLEQVTHQDGWLVLQTATQGSALREIELVIDAASYQVVKQTWLFAGLGRVVCERVSLEQHRKNQD